MMQWITLFKKELLGYKRNYQWIWVPIIFLILGITEPLTNYYMPEIIKMSGGLPEGTIFEFPVPTAKEVFIAGISQLNTIGILVLILTNMGCIAAERKSGVIELILSKPVSLVNYLTSKYVAMLTFGLVSIFLGFLSNYYYTYLLFNDVGIATAGLSYIIYSVWFAFVLMIVIFLNTLLTSQVAIGFCSVIAATIFSVVSGLFTEKLSWSPGLISAYVSELVLTDKVPEALPMALIVTILVIGICIALSLFIFSKKEYALK